MSTPKPFGTYAKSFDDGTGLTSEQRLQLSLIEPQNPNAMGQGQVRAVTQNRIRSAMAELAHGNIDNVNAWIQTVAAGVFDAEGKCIVRPDPARAVELFMEMAQFSLPKLKAVAIDVRSSDGSVKQLSVSELEKIVSEQ
jgi:hypothetical protein